jgi:hypothetical protein
MSWRIALDKNIDHPREPQKSWRIRAEHAFFASWILWLAAVLWWWPDPVISFADAPSARTNPGGFSLFYELVATQTKGARRVLSAPDDFPSDVGVLVLLSPREPVPASDIANLVSWAEKGNTLVIGYPILIKSGSDVEPSQAGLLGCALRELPEKKLSTLSYTGSDKERMRKVPDFSFSAAAVFHLESCAAAPILTDQTTTAIAARQSLGLGTVIELADSSLLSNSSIGWKQTHLWAAALMDEAGRDKVWAFDESYHGIKPEPQLVRLFGAGRLRLLFLHAVLLLVMGYWWRSRRLGPPLPRENIVASREMATLIDDLGAFYLGAGKSLWALERSVEHLRRSLKERGLGATGRAEAEKALEMARQALAGGANDLNAHLPLLGLLARAEQGLDRATVPRPSGSGRPGHLIKKRKIS